MAEMAGAFDGELVRGHVQVVGIVGTGLAPTGEAMAQVTAALAVCEVQTSNADGDVAAVAASFHGRGYVCGLHVEAEASCKQVERLIREICRSKILWFEEVDNERPAWWKLLMEPLRGSCFPFDSHYSVPASDSPNVSPQ
jgi:hypothetical protein